MYAVLSEKEGGKFQFKFIVFHILYELFKWTQYVQVVCISIR